MLSGFKSGLRNIEIKKQKKFLLLGAGGVVPSINWSTLNKI